MTKNTREIVISLLTLGFIVFGIGCHVMRERLRHADLHSWYQQENAAAFGGSSQDADVHGETFGKRTRKGSRTNTMTIRLQSSSIEAQIRQKEKLATL
jgi:hypothetical protein